MNWDRIEGNWNNQGKGQHNGQAQRRSVDVIASSEMLVGKKEPTDHQ